MLQDPLRQQKNARWNDLVDQGLSYDKAKDQVEQEFAARSVLRATESARPGDTEDVSPLRKSAKLLDRFAEPTSKPLPTVQVEAQAPTPFEERVARGMLAARGQLPVAQQAEEAMRGSMDAEKDRAIQETAKAIPGAILHPVLHPIEYGKEEAELFNQRLRKGEYAKAIGGLTMDLLPAAEAVPGLLGAGKQVVRGMSAAGRAARRAEELAKLGVTPEMADQVIADVVKGRVKAGQEIGDLSLYPKRAEGFTGTVDASDYINPRTFGKTAEEQAHAERAMESVVREREVPLRAPRNMTIDGVSFKKGDLLDRESHAQVRAAAAAEMGLEPKQLNNNFNRLGRVEMLRLRSAVADINTAEEEILRQLGTGELTGEAAAEARARLNRITQDRSVMLQTFGKNLTETGRDLAALKIGALQNMDETAWLSRIQRHAQRALTQEETQAIIKAARAKDPARLIQIANDTRKASLGEKIGTYFQTNLLTSPATHAANIGGNLTMQGLEIAKDAPAALADRVLSAALKTGRTKDFAPIEAVTSTARGAKEGAKNALSVLKGEPVLGPGRSLELGRQVNYDNPILDAYTKAIGRSLSAEDELFKGMAFRRSLEEQARVAARAGGAKGKDVADRVAEIMAQPSDLMVSRAMRDAERATFQQPNKVADVALRARRAVNEAGMGLGTVVMPFATTPVNVATTAVGYSPIGLGVNLAKIRKLSNLIKTAPENVAEIQALQKQIAEGIGRGITGTAIGEVARRAALRGEATGTYPTTQRERDQWEEQGKMEGAVKVGDKWYQTSKLAPLGNILQTGAAIAAAQQKEAPQEPGINKLVRTVGAGVSAPIESFASLPMLQNVSDIRDAIYKAGGTDFMDAAARMAGRSVGGMIPGAGLLRAIARATDKTVRETKSPNVGESFVRNIQAGLPIASQSLPPRVDPLGRVKEQPYGPVGSLLSPIPSSPDLTKDDMVISELKRTNAAVGRITQGQREPGQAYAAREQETGQTIRDVLSQIIVAPGYQAIAQMPVDRLRQMAKDAGISMENVSDDRIRSRLQGKILEQAASAIRSQKAKSTKTLEDFLSPLTSSILR